MSRRGPTSLGFGTRAIGVSQDIEHLVGGSSNSDRLVLPDAGFNPAIQMFKCSEAPEFDPVAGIWPIGCTERLMLDLSLGTFCQAFHGFMSECCSAQRPVLELKLPIAVRHNGSVGNASL